MRTLPKVVARGFAICALACALAGAAQAQSFQGIGTLPSGQYGDYTFATGVNVDGTAVSGYACPDASCNFAHAGVAIRWSEVSLQAVGSGFAWALDGTGESVVGISNSTNQAVRWSFRGNIDLGLLPGASGGQSRAYGISEDGNTIVGQSVGYGGICPQAFRRVSTMVSLGFFAGGCHSSAVGVTPNGSIIVGWSRIDDGIRNTTLPFRWIADNSGSSSGGTMSELPVPAGATGGVAMGVSAEGAIIAGYGFYPAGRRAAVWISGFAYDFGVLPGQAESYAYAISSDGSTVVGTSGVHAFVWTLAAGMQRVTDVLTAKGIPFSGWQLREATGVNADGSVIVGNGLAPSGRNQGWVARLAPLLPGKVTADVTRSFPGNEPMGRIVSSPAGIDCPNVCTYRYAAGTQVTFTATPNAGKAFLGWSGATNQCADTPVCTITVNGSTTLGAVFDEGAPVTKKLIWDVSVTVGAITDTDAVTMDHPAGNAEFFYGSFGNIRVRVDVDANRFDVTVSDYKVLGNGCSGGTLTGSGPLQYDQSTRVAQGSISGQTCAGFLTGTFVATASDGAHDWTVVDAGQAVDSRILGYPAVGPIRPAAGLVIKYGAFVETSASGTVKIKYNFDERVQVEIGPSSIYFPKDPRRAPSFLGSMVKGRILVTCWALRVGLIATPYAILSYPVTGLCMGLQVIIFSRPTSDPENPSPDEATLEVTSTGGAVIVTDNQARSVTINSGETHRLTAVQPAVVAAVLPNARTAVIGQTVTAFATVINTGAVPASACRIEAPTNVAASVTFQTTSASNQLSGIANAPADIPAGQAQNFIFAIRPQAALSQEVALVFSCGNSGAATSVPGLNTLLLTAATPPLPDVLSIADTLTRDGIANIPGAMGTGIMATASINIGRAATVTCSATPTPVGQPTRSLAANLSICQTNSAGVCFNPATPGPDVTLTVAANQISTFAAFIQGTGQAIPFDPANKRVFFVCKEGTTAVGQASVAVRTQ